MYQVDEKDRVRELKELPAPNVGAPLPSMIADEHILQLVYLAERPDPDWDGTRVKVLDADSDSEPVVVVTFDRASAHFFGPPNDEAFEGHPLSPRGLRRYAVWEVEHSSWIRILERMNSVHPMHSPEAFDDLHHYIFTFHDSTFECVASGLEWRIESGSIKSVLKSCLAAWE